MDDGIKRMDITEFRELGILQEVNRQFLHPLGLALEVDQTADGERLGGIWDYREDPEGIVFGDGVINRAKAEHVAELQVQHAEARIEMFDDIIQPLPEEADDGECE